MKKYIFIILWLLIGAVLPSYGDESVSIKLNNKGHEKDTVSYTDFCNIFIELSQEYSDNRYKIAVKLENYSSTNYKILCLFDKPYLQKELRKMSIVYDKSFPGGRSDREVEACKGLSQNYKLLPSDEALGSFYINADSCSLITYNLPVYIAKEKKRFGKLGKKRTVLIEKRIIELNINVDLGPDEEYVRLLQTTDSLINEIKVQKFCSNKNHQGTPLKQLKEIYTQSIEKLKKEVRQIQDSLHEARNYRYESKEYKQFTALCEKLDSINLDKLVVGSCNNDHRKRATHTCKYCSLSIEEIYSRLDKHYANLLNDSDKKEQIINDVEVLYTCAQKNKKRKTGSFMPKITKYYKRFKSK